MMAVALREGSESAARKTSARGLTRARTRTASRRVFGCRGAGGGRFGGIERRVVAHGLESLRYGSGPYCSSPAHGSRSSGNSSARTSSRARSRLMPRFTTSDGFRALALVEGHRCRPVPRRAHAFPKWDLLCEETAHSVRAVSAVIAVGL